MPMLFDYTLLGWHRRVMQFMVKKYPIMEKEDIFSSIKSDTLLLGIEKTCA